MFTLQKNPVFKATAIIIVPTEDGDTEQTLGVMFRLMPKDADQMLVDEFLRAAVISLDDIVDEAGNPLSCTDVLLAQMLALPFVGAGLMRAYWKALTKAKLGN